MSDRAGFKRQVIFPVPWGCNCENVEFGDYDHRCANRPQTPPRGPFVHDLIDLEDDFAGLGLKPRRRKPKGVTWAPPPTYWKPATYNQGTQTDPPPTTTDAACTATHADIKRATYRPRTRWVFPPPTRRPKSPASTARPKSPARPSRSKSPRPTRQRPLGCTRGRGIRRTEERPSLIPRRPRSRNARSPAARERSWHREGSPDPWRVPTPPAYYPDGSSDDEWQTPSPTTLAGLTKSARRRVQRERAAARKAAEDVGRVLDAAREMLERRARP